MGRFLRCSNSSLWGISRSSSPSWLNLWFSFGTCPLVFFALRTTLCEPLASVFIFLVHPSLTYSVLMSIHGRQSADLQHLRVKSAIFRGTAGFARGKPMNLSRNQRNTYLLDAFLGGLLELHGGSKTARFDVLGVHFGIGQHSTCGT